VWPQPPVVASALPFGQHPVKDPLGYNTSTGRYQEVAADMEPSELPGCQVERREMEGTGVGEVV